MHHAFLYISLPSVHDYDVKLSNFTFFGGREHKTTSFFFFSWTLMQYFRIQLQKNLPTFDEMNDKVWSSETSLFKWRIRGRRRRCCLSSLLLLKQPVYLPFVLINGRCFPLFIFTPRLYCFFKQIFFLRLLQVEKGLTAKLLTQVTAINLVGII